MQFPECIYLGVCFSVVCSVGVQQCDYFIEYQMENELIQVWDVRKWCGVKWRVKCGNIGSFGSADLQENVQAEQKRGWNGDCCNRNVCGLHNGKKENIHLCIKPNIHWCIMRCGAALFRFVQMCSVRTSNLVINSHI